MSLFQMFLLGIGSVVLIVVVVALIWAASRNKTMKLTKGLNNVWVGTAALGLLVIIDLAFDWTFFNYVIGLFTPNGQMEWWMQVLLVSIAGTALYTIFRRREGAELLRGIILFVTIIGVSGFMLNALSNIEDHPTDFGCTTTPFQSKISEQKTFVLLGARTLYTAKMEKGRERDFRIEFADEPLAGQSSFDPGPVENFVDVAYYGDGTELSDGLTVGSVRLKTSGEAYRSRVNNRCLGYYVFLADHSSE